MDQSLITTVDIATSISEKTCNFSVLPSRYMGQITDAIKQHVSNKIKNKLIIKSYKNTIGRPCMCVEVSKNGPNKLT